MQLNLNRIKNELLKNENIQNFINELGRAIINMENDINLTDEELREYDKQKSEFLQDFFNNNKDAYIVHLKYKNDPANRYKLEQYKDNFQQLYVTHKKNLPENVEVGDVVVKGEDGNYHYDYDATNYIKSELEKIKNQIKYN